MSNFDDHPTVRQVRKMAASKTHDPRGSIESMALRAFALERGADDCGFVSIENPALSGERDHVLRCFPATRTLMAIVRRMNREQVRSPARSLANLEFHEAGVDVDAIARDVVRHLGHRGIRAVNSAMAFPMELDRFPGRGWVVSHKIVAQAAGLGKMGIHRSLIHPKFGSFVLLGIVLLDVSYIWRD